MERITGVGADSSIHSMTTVGGLHLAACWGVYEPVNAGSVARVTHARFLLHRAKDVVGPNIRAYGIEVDPARHNRQVLTAITGVYVTKDRGRSWRRLNDLPEGEFHSATSIPMAPSSSPGSQAPSSRIRFPMPVPLTSKSGRDSSTTEVEVDGVTFSSVRLLRLQQTLRAIKMLLERRQRLLRIRLQSRILRIRRFLLVDGDRLRYVRQPSPGHTCDQTRPPSASETDQSSPCSVPRRSRSAG